MPPPEKGTTDLERSVEAYDATAVDMASFRPGEDRPESLSPFLPDGPGNGSDEVSNREERILLSPSSQFSYDCLGGVGVVVVGGAAGPGLGSGPEPGPGPERRPGPGPELGRGAESGKGTGPGRGSRKCDNTASTVEGDNNCDGIGAGIAVVVSAGGGRGGELAPKDGEIQNGGSFEEARITDDLVVVVVSHDDGGEGGSGVGRGDDVGDDDDDDVADWKQDGRLEEGPRRAASASATCCAASCSACLSSSFSSDRAGGGVFVDPRRVGSAVVVHEGESTVVRYVPEYHAPPSSPFGGGGRGGGGGGGGGDGLPIPAAAKTLRRRSSMTRRSSSPSYFVESEYGEAIVRMNNEYNILTRFLSGCNAVREALSIEYGGSASGLGGKEEKERADVSTLYLEWIEGASLRDWLDERRMTMPTERGGERTRGVELTKHDILRDVKLMRAVATALADVHEVGVIHNDFTAKNVIVCDCDDGEFAVKLIDFGYAAYRHALESDDVGETVNDDLYSLALVLCEIAIDRPITDAVRDGVDTLMASFFRHSSLPRSLITLLSDALEFQSSLHVQPFRSVREVANDLDQMVEDPDRFLFDPISPDEVAERGEFAFIPDKLYGRTKDAWSALLGAYERNLCSVPIPKPRMSSSGIAGRLSAPAVIQGGPFVQGERGARVQEIMLVSGPTGSGKSRLVHRVFARLATEGRLGGLLAWGSYEKFRYHQPYSAFTDALNGLCDRILLWNETDLDCIRTEILEAVGPEGNVLIPLVPNLRRIIGEPGGEVACIGSMEAQNRLKYVTRMFFRVLSAQDHPVALVLENLHWADAASLDLIGSLITDPELRSFIFVGCHQNLHDFEGANCTATRRTSMKSGATESSDKSFTTGRSSQLASLLGFAAFVAQIEDYQECGKLRICRIEVASLDRESMNLLISDALRMPARLIKPLTDSIYPKARGNIQFTVEYLKQLKDNGALTFDRGLFRWLWNTDELRSHPIADCMADLIAGEIEKLSFEVRRTLILAACIGMRFDRAILEKAARCVVDRGDEIFCSADDLSQHLEILETGGFIEVRDHYTFAHSRIHEAVYAALPRKERCMVHYQIGKVLWDSALDQEKSDILFTAVGHMNKAKKLLKDDLGKRAHLAMLNVRAGKESLEKSAFVPALDYLMTACGLLPADHWKDHYDMSLTLYNTLVEAEQCSGRYEQMDSHLAQVFNHAKCYHDKLTAYKVLVRAYGAQKKLRDAINTGLDVLFQLGQPFPENRPSMLEIGVDYVKTRIALRGKTDAVLKNLPEMKDKTALDAMQVISSLVWYAYLSREELVPLLTFRMVRLTLQYGVSKVTAFAFAMYGMILCGGMSDYKGGNRFADLAFYFLETIPAKEWVARVNGGCYYCVRHWREPLSLSLEPLLRSHRVGQEAGDLEYACVIAQCYCCHAFHSGESLVDLEEKAGEFCFNMEQYNQTTVYYTTLPLWQTVLNLMGHSRDPLQLTGDAMNEEEVYSEALKEGNTACAYIILFYRMVLSYIFGNYEAALEMAKRTHDIDQVIMASFFSNEHSFYSGLTACALMLARKRKKKWKRLALHAKRKMKKMAKKSAGNCLHKYLLLKAEMAAASLDRTTAKRYYDEAIKSAAENRFIQDEAIANERAYSFLKKCGDMEAASRYRQRSHLCFMKWGAFGKARLLSSVTTELVE